MCEFSSSYSVTFVPIYPLRALQSLSAASSVPCFFNYRGAFFILFFLFPLRDCSNLDKQTLSASFDLLPRLSRHALLGFSFSGGRLVLDKFVSFFSFPP